AGSISGWLSSVRIAFATHRPAEWASITPLDSTGSTKAAASPAKYHPGPATRVCAYDQLATVCVRVTAVASPAAGTCRAERNNDTISGTRDNVSSNTSSRFPLSTTFLRVTTPTLTSVGESTMYQTHPTGGATEKKTLE